MSEQIKHFYVFGPFRLDPGERLLLRQGEVVPLAPKAIETLLTLVEHHGHMLAKDELMKLIWPDTFVEEGNLAQHIFTLRRVLGENQNGQQYIETVPRRGYRFVAGVKEEWHDPPKLIVNEHVRSNLRVDNQEETNASVPDRMAWMRSAIREVALRGRPASRALAASLMLTVLSAALFYYWASGHRKENGSVTGVRSLAVLPFKTIGVQNGDDYLGLGMADALITRLGNLRQVSVRPTNGVRKYNSPGQDPLLAGRELKVDAVLDGNIQRVGDRMRLTVQLVSVKDGTPLWTEKFDEQFTNILTLQDAISEQVAGALTLKLTGEQKQSITKRHTGNVEAYQSYLLGRYFWDKRSGAGVKRAVDYFQHAIKIDSNYALAYAGLADCYISGHLEIPQKEAYAKAEAAALKALQLDETLAEAHTSLAITRYFAWDWRGMERELKQAIGINPNYAAAHEWYGLFLENIGRKEESFAEIFHARELDPLSLTINTAVGRNYFHSRQYDKAIPEYQKTLEIDPNSLWPRLRLAQALAQKGMAEEAFAEFQKARALLKDNGVIDVVDIRLAQAYAILDKRSEAMKILDRWKNSPNNLSLVDVAIIYIGLGEKDEAFALLQQAYEKHDVHLASLKVDPRFDPIQSDPRYTDLLRRVGIAP